MAKKSTSTPAPQQQSLLQILQPRFQKFLHRHKDVNWEDVQARLTANTTKLQALAAMESTGGEPDVIRFDAATGEYIFCDCSAESPAGRRSLCYDRQGWESRKDARPENTAVDVAAEMGITLLTEDEYRYLQTLGDFDTKTSSWLLTPVSIRAAGGAIFGDRRYGHVFVYYNGAQSYYAARGFRGMLRV